MVIFLHPSSLLFLLTLLASIVTMSSVDSWFTAWLALEINMMAFTPLIQKKNSKYSTESAIKYFLAQSLASMNIILASLFMNNLMLAKYMILLALLFKMGAAPGHIWAVSIVNGMSWQTFMAFIMPQKIGLLLLLSPMLHMNTSTNNLAPIMFSFIIISAITGSLGGLTQPWLPKILMFSSISHTSMILASLMVSPWMWITYFTIYSIMVIPLIKLLEKSQMFSLTQLFTNQNTYENPLLAFYLISLAGMPPLSGFLPKIIVINALFMSNMLFISTILLLSTLINLFFYLRMVMANMLINSGINNFNKNKKKKKYLIHLMMLTLAPLLMLSSLQDTFMLKSSHW